MKDGQATRVPRSSPCGGASRSAARRSCAALLDGRSVCVEAGWGRTHAPPIASLFAVGLGAAVLALLGVDWTITRNARRDEHVHLAGLASCLDHRRLRRPRRLGSAHSAGVTA
jgi:hypothetical protein